MVISKSMAVGIGLLLIGFIVVFAGVSYAYNFGLFGKPLGTQPIDSQTGKPAAVAHIYGQATLLWSKIAWGTNLKITNLDWSQTQPYSLQIASLFLGSGPVKCRADLISNSQIVSTQEKNIEPFGGVGNSDVAYFNFGLLGYVNQDYKIRAYCADTSNAENNDRKEITIRTVAT